MNYRYKFDPERCYFKGTDKGCNCTQETGCPDFALMDYLMATSGLPASKQQRMEIFPDAVDEKSYQRLQNIGVGIRKFTTEGQDLYIYGSNTGSGKTTWAIKLLHAHFVSVYKYSAFKTQGIFIHVPSFLARLKSSFRTQDVELEQIISLLSTVGVVVWDDIASTSMTDFDSATLLTYIDQRVINEKTNIYTGNLAYPEIKDALGERLCSRVWNKSVKVELKGVDRRLPEW